MEEKEAESREFSMEVSNQLQGDTQPQGREKEHFTEE